MVETADNYQAHRERELILRLVDAQPDHSAIDTIALRGALSISDVSIPWDRFDRHIDYLTQQGFLGRRVHPLGRYELRVVWITAAGMNLLDGSSSDPGVSYHPGPS